MTTTNASNNIDLVKLFGTVAKTMVQSQAALNEADSYNHDHGDNMVQVFNTITKAIKEKPNANVAAQLGHASAVLGKSTTSGSAKLYAEGLKDAADQFAGQKSITTNDAMQLIQLLLGSTSTQATSATSGTTGSAGTDLFGSLLGGLSGEQAQSSNQPGIDLGDIVNAGMSFLQAKQSGKSNIDAALSALVSSSKVGNQDYRAQSATLVANSLINAVSQMSKAKK